MRSSEDTAVDTDGNWWVIDSGMVTQFGDDSGLYRVGVPRTDVVELHRGEPLGDTVDLLIAKPLSVPNSKADCRTGGWEELTDHHGVPFKNQGDCVSYVATGG